MARNENAPFDRGTVDSASALDTLRGKTFTFEDINLNPSTPGAKPTRTGKYVTVMLVKNGSGFTILPKRLVVMSTVAGEYGIVKGYARLTATGPCFPVDEYIPAAGVPDGSYFFVVVGGPALVLTGIADMSADVAVGDRVVALTAVTSGATTAGRIAPIDLTGATALLANQILNFIGQAMTARTTQNTNTDMLVDVYQRVF